MGSSLAGQDAALLVNLWARPDCIDLLLIQSLPKSNLELPLDALQNSVKKFVFFSSRVFTCRFGLNFNTSYTLALLVTASLACSSWALRRIERPWFVRIGTILSGKGDSISHTRCTCDWGMPLLEAGYGTDHFWRLCPHFIGEARFRCWMYTGLPILPIWLASSLLVAYYHRLSSPDGASPTPRGFSTFQAMYHGICMMSGTLIWLVGSLCWRRPTICDYDAIRIWSYSLSSCMLIIPSWYSFPFSSLPQSSGYGITRSLVGIL